MELKIFSRLLYQLTFSTVMLHNNPKLENTVLFFIIWLADLVWLGFKLQIFPSCLPSSLGTVLCLEMVEANYGDIGTCDASECLDLDLAHSHFCTYLVDHVMSPGQTQDQEIHSTFSERKYKVTWQRAWIPGGRRQEAVGSQDGRMRDENSIHNS